MNRSTSFLTILAMIVAVSPLSAGDVYGINPADMDTSVSACQDFNLFANGGWIKANPIPPDQSVWGSFTILQESSPSGAVIAVRAAAGLEA